MDTLNAEISMNLPDLNHTLDDVWHMEVGQQENNEERSEIARLTLPRSLQQARKD